MSQVALQPASLSQFQSMNQLGVFLLLYDGIVHCLVTPNIKFTGTCVERSS